MIQEVGAKKSTYVKLCGLWVLIIDEKIWALKARAHV